MHNCFFEGTKFINGKKTTSNPTLILVVCGMELSCLTDSEIKGNGCQKVKVCYGLGCQYSSEPDYHFNWNSQYLVVINSI